MMLLHSGYLQFRVSIPSMDTGRAMSQENVEIVRTVYERTTRGKGANTLDLYDPEVEVVAGGALGHLVGGGIYHGHDGVRQFYRSYYDAWEHVSYDVRELIDAGEQVVSVVTNRGRGRASGVALEWQVPGVWTFRNGKIARVVWFSSRAEALEAVGLSE
jgi:ketosteroid isomerase-like protein